jgi:hypothetical protein
VTDQQGRDRSYPVEGNRCVVCHLTLQPEDSGLCEAHQYDEQQGRDVPPADDDTDWAIRPEETCQECLAEADDDLGAYLAAVVRNHPHATNHASGQS